MRRRRQQQYQRAPELEYGFALAREPPAGRWPAGTGSQTPGNYRKAHRNLKKATATNGLCDPMTKDRHSHASSVGALLAVQCHTSLVASMFLAPLESNGTEREA